MPQAQTGLRKSVPKVVRVNAADGEAVLFRNLGNGRRLPFIWGTDVTLASGVTEVVISSGVKFNDHKVSESIVLVTPTNADSAGKEYYVSKDTVTNKVSLVVNSNTTDLAFDVMIMLGVGYDFLSTHSNQIWKRHYSN
jgi:acetylglutamate kinase